MSDSDKKNTTAQILSAVEKIAKKNSMFEDENFHATAQYILTREHDAQEQKQKTEFLPILPDVPVRKEDAQTTKMSFHSPQPENTQTSYLGSVMTPHNAIPPQYPSPQAPQHPSPAAPQHPSPQAPQHPSPAAPQHSSPPSPQHPSPQAPRATAPPPSQTATPALPHQQGNENTGRNDDSILELTDVVGKEDNVSILPHIAAELRHVSKTQSTDIQGAIQESLPDIVERVEKRLEEEAQATNSHITEAMIKKIVPSVLRSWLANKGVPKA